MWEPVKWTANPLENFLSVGGTSTLYPRHYPPRSIISNGIDYFLRACTVLRTTLTLTKSINLILRHRETIDVSNDIKNGPLSDIN